MPARFTFLRQRDAAGIFMRYRARILAKGYLQRDTLDTFAPVVDFSTVRTCLAVAVKREYVIEQMDVWAAFFR